MTNNFKEMNQLKKQIDKSQQIDRTKLETNFVPYHPLSSTGLNESDPLKTTPPPEDTFTGTEDSSSWSDVETLGKDDSFYADGESFQIEKNFWIPFFW